jgi:hypothetical protein
MFSLDYWSLLHSHPYFLPKSSVYPLVGIKEEPYWVRSTATNVAT